MSCPFFPRPCRPLRLISSLALGASALGLVGGAAAVQDPPASEPPVAAATQPAGPTTAPAPIELDARWLGRWEGRCRVLQPGNLVAGEFTMGLTISRIESEEAGEAEVGLPQYNWTIVYDNGQTQQTRPYLLKPAVDDSGQPVPGHYLVDEQNGIVVDQFLVGDTMQGHFIVASGERQTVLHARYALEETEEGEPGLLVEIASYDGNFARASGTAENGVVSRPMRSIQTGLLLKQAE